MLMCFLYKFKFLAVCLFSLFIILFVGCSSQNTTSKKNIPKILNGKISFDNWDFKKDNSVNINLDQQLEFYEDILLTPIDFSNPNFSLKPNNTGASNNKWDIELLKSSSKGYGTFKLDIFISSKD